MYQPFEHLNGTARLTWQRSGFFDRSRYFLNFGEVCVGELEYQGLTKFSAQMRTVEGSWQLEYTPFSELSVYDSQGKEFIYFDFNHWNKSGLLRVRESDTRILMHRANWFSNRVIWRLENGTQVAEADFSMDWSSFSMKMQLEIHHSLSAMVDPLVFGAINLHSARYFFSQRARRM